jgi:hypothetical protein
MIHSTAYEGELYRGQVKTKASHVQEIPESVRAAINSRTRAILAKQQDAFSKLRRATCPNVSKWREATLASA